MLQEFQGWTPATVDDLTFDQLDGIFRKINKYRKRVPPLDVAVESLRRVIFKYLGVKEQKSDPIDIGKLTGFPTAKVTNEEMQAWYKTGMKESFSKFIKKYRKAHK